MKRFTVFAQGGRGGGGGGAQGEVNGKKTSVGTKSNGSKKTSSGKKTKGNQS